MRNNISIKIFRVSADSKYLEMIFSCSDDYYFISLFLEVRYIENKKYVSKNFDISSALFAPTGEIIKDKQEWTVRLSLDKLGISVPAIYKATFKISKKSDLYSNFTCDPESGVYINQYGFKELTSNCKASANIRTDLQFDINTHILTNNLGEVHNSIYTYVCDDSEGIMRIYETDFPEFIECTSEENSLDCDCIDNTCLEDLAVCSDVNYAYKCMLDDLFMNEGECEDVIPDELIRKYLLLYGHQAALQVHDFESAETYFRLIGNCFNACAPTGRGTGSCCNKHINLKPCNCGR